MIPVPAYLKKMAQNIKTRNNWTSFAVCCGCGSHAFIPYVNYLTPEEKRLMKPYYDSLDYLLSGCWGTTCTYNENGKLHRWKLLTPAGLDGPKEEVFISEQPFFAMIAVVKIKCQHCGAEHLVFDSRYHGYDGITGNHTEEKVLYQPHFRSKGTEAVGIEIKIENDPSIESFQENTGLSFAEEQYSEAFSWIKIYAVKQNGKKHVILDYETT